MEANLEREHVAMGASSVQDDSVKSRILERIKAQMDQEFTDPRPGGGIPPIYLKMIDGWP